MNNKIFCECENVKKKIDENINSLCNYLISIIDSHPEIVVEEDKTESGYEAYQVDINNQSIEIKSFKLILDIQNPEFELCINFSENSKSILIDHNNKKARDLYAIIKKKEELCGLNDILNTIEDINKKSGISIKGGLIK